MYIDRKNLAAAVVAGALSWGVNCCGPGALAQTFSEPFFMTNVLTQRFICVDVDGQPGLNNGAKLQVFDCEYSRRSGNGQATDQVWQFVERVVPGQGSGPVLFIRNERSGKCLDVDGQPGTLNGARLQLFTCEYSGYSGNGSKTDQVWDVQTFPGQEHPVIANRTNQGCIDVDGQPGTANGARLQIWDCEPYGTSANGRPTDQFWYITYVPANR